MCLRETSQRYLTRLPIDESGPDGMFVGNGVAGLAEHLARIDNDLDKPQPLPRKIIWLEKPARRRNDLYSFAGQWPIERRSNDRNIPL